MTFGNVREVRVSHKLSRDDKGKFMVMVTAVVTVILEVSE